MAAILSSESISKSHGRRNLFRGISLGIDSREGIGLIGPNGAGKTTLLRILAGEEKPDSGSVSLRRGTRLGFVPQTEALPPGQTVREILQHALSDRPADDHEKELQVEIMISRCGFPDAEQKVEHLSGGWRKRLAIAGQVIREPDLLLLDEPTNHLDLEGILWLEALLRKASFAYLVVSHDRAFLEGVVTRVVELNRAYPDGCLSVEGTYSDFLIRREEFLAAQAHQEIALSSQVRREIAWLRRGARARTTKAQHRVRDAEKMIGSLEEIKTRNAQGRTAAIDFSATGRRTRELLVARNLAKSVGGRVLFRKLSFALSPGIHLGVLGPNGSGKTTLLRLLARQAPPDEGSVTPAQGLRTVFFDQARETLDLNVTLKEALAGERDMVEFLGKPVHVSSWAKRFLFSPDQLTLPVSELSGGEQARVLIARLMLQPADLLILDEPTNDLDIPTLEVLEESLADFPGALVLVTHDRFLLDRVSTELLGLDGRGGARLFADYAQWEAAQLSTPGPTPRAAVPAAAARSVLAPAAAGIQALTMKEQKELTRMETTIQSAEAAVASLLSQLASPAVAADHIRTRELSEELQAAQERVEALYARWEELESRNKP